MLLRIHSGKICKIKAFADLQGQEKQWDSTEFNIQVGILMYRVNKNQGRHLSCNMECYKLLPALSNTNSQNIYVPKRVRSKTYHNKIFTELHPPGFVLLWVV